MLYAFVGAYILLASKKCYQSVLFPRQTECRTSCTCFVCDDAKRSCFSENSDAGTDLYLPESL